MFQWVVDIKDGVIRYVSKLVFLSQLDGKKKHIMRVLQGLNLVVLGVSALVPSWGPLLNEKWSWILVLAGHLGLEFAIEDEEIKIKKGVDTKSVLRKSAAPRRK